MKLSEIKSILNATVLVGEDRMDQVVLGAGAADLMEDVLAAAAEGAVLLTGLKSEEVVRIAKIAGVCAIVFVRGKQPDGAIIRLADSINMPILLTKDSLFVASGRLYMNGLRGLDGSW